MTPRIRPEMPRDQAAIREITRRAFAPMPFADGDEQDVIDRFRGAGVLALSLVADLEGAIVGQISFTPAFAADGSPDWYALGPVAVAPEHQGNGIGSQLVRAGIDWLRSVGAAGCVLVGNPVYYRRFGFVLASQLAPAGEPAEYYQMLSLGCENPNTVVGFHPLFHSPA